MENNPETTLVSSDAETAVAEPQPKKVKHSSLSLKLNKFFHHIDRGGTLKGEVMSGLTVFFISLCVIFMNVQMIASSLGATVVTETTPGGAVNIENAVTIASLYCGAVLVAFIGSLVVGLAARLPFVQVSMMGLGSSMICLVGTSSGLTYYNLLFVSFISAIIYAALVSVPVVRKYVFAALPAPVRKILPAAVGLATAFAALQASGVVSAQYVSVGGSAAALPVITGGMESSVTVIAFVAATVAIALYIALRALKLKHPVFWSFIGGTLTFILVMLMAGGLNTSAPDSFINFGRLWTFVGSQASDVTPFGDSWFSYLSDGMTGVFKNFGAVFTKGTQFAEGAGGASFVISGVLCYLFIGMYDAEATLRATGEDINRSANEAGKVDFDTQKGVSLALMCNAGMNVIGPLFGAGGVSFSRSSVASTRDNGKSGLVSIVAAIGFLVALFVWIGPILFATDTFIVGSMNEFNYNAYGNGGFIACFSALSFGIADAVLVCVGASMLRSFGEIDFKDVTEAVPAIVTVAATLLLTNLAYGVALGTLSFALTKLLSFRRSEGDGWLASLKANFVGDLKEIGIPTGVLCVLMILMLALA